MEGAELHRLHRRVDGAEGGKDDDDGGGRALLDGGEDLETAHPGHLQVGDDDCRRFLGEEDEAAFAVRGGVNVVTLLLQVVLQHASKRAVVIYDKYLRGHVISGRGLTGADTESSVNS